MGVLWEHQTDGTHYSVRQSGASIRLYSNKVFHSQWNPAKPFAGGIWDCLSLPVLYRPPETVQNILLLGVGGGTVIRQLQHLIKFTKLAAIDIDDQHLQIARQWFGVNDERVDLLHADATRWLQRYDEEPFDIIIDDLFGHSDGEPQRACALNTHWLDTLATHLKPAGVLVINCVSSRELTHALPAMASVGFNSGYRWTLPAYENAIAVLGEQSLRARDWSRNLENSGLGKIAQRQARATVRRPLRGFEMS